MSLIDKLGDWYQFFDVRELNTILCLLIREYNSCHVEPNSKTIFKAFEITPVDCKVIIIAQDPYPQKDISTGIAFGNDRGKSNKFSPSLIKLVEPLEVDDTFDYSLSSWCKQGVLMLNSALTTIRDKPNSHQLLWRPFITTFLKNYSVSNTDIVYVLLGKYAQSLKPYIQYSSNIIEVNHPSYLVRNNIPMPNIYQQINNSLLKLNKPIIRWYD